MRKIIKLEDISHVKTGDLELLNALIKANGWTNVFIKAEKDKIYLCSDIEIKEV